MLYKFVISLWLVYASYAFAAEKMVSLSLEQTIQKAISNDPKLRSIESILNASESARFTRISKFFPSIHVDTQIATYKDRIKTEYESSAPLVARERNHYLGELVFEQNLFSGFSDYSSYKENQAERESKYFDLQQAKLDSIINSIEMYFNIQYLRIHLNAAKNHSDNLKAQLQESENKWKSGRATELDYLTYLYEHEKQNPQIMEINHNLRIEILRLSEMMGENLNTELILSDEIIPAFTSLSFKNFPNYEEIEKIFLERNFKLLALKKELEVSEYKVGQVTASHAPTLLAQYRLQQSADRRNELLDQDNRNQVVMLQLHVPIFSGLSSISQRKEAVELKRSKAENVHAWLQTARVELMQLQYRLEHLKVLVKSEKVNENVASKRVISLKNQYQLGKVTVKDYLDSLALQLQVKTNLAQSQKNYIITYFKLKGMLGEFPMDIKN